MEKTKKGYRVNMIKSTSRICQYFEDKLKFEDTKEKEDKEGIALLIYHLKIIMILLKNNAKITTTVLTIIKQNNKTNGTYFDSVLCE